MAAPELASVRALVFDVFGTVVDWRGSVIRAAETLGRAKGLSADWPRFADQWRREGYVDAIGRIRRGEEPWADADTLHRRKLDALLPDYGLGGLSEAEVADLSRVWHRLDPWPDSVAGLTRLKRRFLAVQIAQQLRFEERQGPREGGARTQPFTRRGGAQSDR